MNNKVLVIGGDHYNTLGIIEGLGQKGVRPFVIVHTKDKISYVIKSKYLQNGWICHSLNEIITCMHDNFKHEQEKVIVFTAADDIACLLDANYNDLCEDFILPNAQKQGEINRLISKGEMAHLAQSIGINIPKTWIISNKEIPEDIEYPCITKAISSVDGSKDNLCICKNIDELRDFMDNPKHCHTILIQKYIDKAFEFQLMGCSMDETKEVIIPGRSYLDRPNGINNAYFLQYDQLDPSFDNTLEKAKTFIQSTGYSGLFSVEYLRDKQGEDYFMEMNFRNDGNSICVTDAGTNLPYIWYLYYSGGDYRKEIEISTVKEVYWQPEFYYFLNIFTREISVGEWFRNLKKTTSYSNYFKADKKPWRCFLYIELIHGLRKIGNLFKS